MFIILDNAESILYPQETDAGELRAVVKEPETLGTLAWASPPASPLFPPHCKWLKIPTLSMEAVRDTFYSIYGDDEQSNIVDDPLRCLDFHALSIALLTNRSIDWQKRGVNAACKRSRWIMTRAWQQPSNYRSIPLRAQTWPGCP